MWLLSLYIVYSFSAGIDFRRQNLIDVFRRQILTFEVDPRTVRVAHLILFIYFDTRKKTNVTKNINFAKTVLNKEVMKGKTQSDALHWKVILF